MRILIPHLQRAQRSDKVSLTESTITWSTLTYATTADNGFVDGSLDTKTSSIAHSRPGCRESLSQGDARA